MKQYVYRYHRTLRNRYGRQMEATLLDDKLKVVRTLRTDVDESLDLRHLKNRDLVAFQYQERENLPKMIVAVTVVKQTPKRFIGP